MRGLPVSEAPVLEVCSTSNDWSSESDEMAVEWDGDEAFYSLDNNRERPCVLRGDPEVDVAALKAKDKLESEPAYKPHPGEHAHPLRPDAQRC